MIVVLDTNIWLKELILNSASGSALRLFLKHRPAELAIPEIIRLEVESNLRTSIQSSIEEITKANRQLLTIFGSMKEIILPTHSEIEDLVSKAFEKLGINVIDVPFSLEAAKSSFFKTIQKLPPCDKTQEFKDGVLWHNCLELLEHDDVLLATQDKAFYKNREYDKGLAENLNQEALSKPHRLTITHSVADVLKHVECDIQIDNKKLIETLKSTTHKNSKQILDRSNAEECGKSLIKYELFATENPEQIYFTYSIETPCQDQANDKSNMTLISKGHGIFTPTPFRIIESHPDEEILYFTNPDGSPGQTGAQYLSAYGVMGHRTITHSVRHPIPKEQEN